MKAFWPPLDRLTEEADLALFAIRPEVLSMDLPWLQRADTPPVIPVVTCENPVIVEAVLRLNALCVIASPVTSSGLLTSIAVAVSQSDNTAMQPALTPAVAWPGTALALSFPGEIKATMSDPSVRAPGSRQSASGFFTRPT